MTPQRPASFVIALCLCAGAPSHADSLLAAQASARSEQNAPRWIQARQKPNGSGVQVRYTAPTQLRLGQAGAVRLQLSGVSAPASVELRASHPDVRLEIDGATAQGALDLRAGEVRSLEVRVTASSEGLHYLNVFTTQHGRPSVTAVPLRVGSANLQPKPGGTVQTTPSGERIISLPASR